jgi:hypothetical protein
LIEKNETQLLLHLIDPRIYATRDAPSSEFV